jgi:hypothetical protein
MKYLLVVLFLVACAGPKPEPEISLDDVPPPTIEEIDKSMEQIEKPKAKLPKKLPKKKVKNAGGNSHKKAGNKKGKSHN